MKGRKLKVGQHVIVLGHYGPKHGSPRVLTVVAIEYPFAVFSYRAPSPPTLSMGPGMGPILTGSKATQVETFTMDVRKHRFQRVSDQFKAISNNEGDEAWLDKLT